MFDKNDFKEKFRCWTELNPEATTEEAKSFCDILIPFEYKENYSWLEEQSIAWFTWKKETKDKIFIAQSNENEDYHNSLSDRKIM